MLADAAAEHASLMAQLSPELRKSLPVDAQGVTRAIEHLAAAAGLSESGAGGSFARTPSIRPCSTPASSGVRR